MIEEIISKLEEANNSYRNGNAIMTDYDYDQLLERLYEIDSDNYLFNKVGIEVINEDRKAKLPIVMASMNKVKTISDLKNWIRIKGFKDNTQFVITPKYDGVSLCSNELEGGVFTRGDGVFGQRRDDHYKLIKNHLKLDKNPFKFTYGELMMTKKVFNDKYSKWKGTGEFSNPRNLIAGLINSTDVKEILKDCQYIKYGAMPLDNSKFKNKSEILEELNKGQEYKVHFINCFEKDITEEFLISLFKEWSSEYEIDGLIIEIDDLDEQNYFGRENSTNNPSYARAFKHESFEQSSVTRIIEIEFNISKQGFLKPVAIIDPIFLDGVVVSRCTLNNYKYVKDMGIGIGAKVVIRRSGMVIPLIVEVLESVDFVMPTINGVEIDWNEAGIELITLTETDDQRLKKIISFFEILEADFVGEGVIAQLWEAEYKTISAILNLTTADLEKIDRFGRKKAQIVFDSVQKSVTGVQLSKLQHATGIFKNMGSKKLVLLEHFVERPNIEDVIKIDGIGEILAHEYIDSYDIFFDFIKDLPVTIVEKVEAVKVGADLEGKSFVFTGVRRIDLESDIESRGGKISSGVSKTTTHLVMKAIGSGSSKEKKAIELGVQVITIEQLEELLN